MATRTNQRPPCSGVFYILAHGVHMSLIGVMALQTELNLIGVVQQASVIR